MAHSIGKTIAELRKEKGWTQVELAEKLQVSDKAVSKWEKDDAFPSVEFFPILAELFEVNIDYLMTGKEIEPKIITMSKAELCAKNDDLTLLKDIKIESKDESGKNIIDYIVQYESLKVFSAICDKHCKMLNKMDFKTLFKFSLIANRTDILSGDIIDCLYITSSGFKSQVKTAGIKNLFHEEKKSIRYIHDNTICCIDDDLIDIIVKDERVSNDTISYILSKHGRMTSVWYQIVPYIIHQSYLHNNLVLFEKCISVAITNNRYAYENYPLKYDSYEGYNYDLLDFLIANRPNPYAYSDQYFDKGLHGLVRILEKTIKLALDKGDFDFVDQFNKINSDVKKYYDRFDCYVANDDEIRVAKLKADKSVSSEELAIQSSLHNGILNVEEILTTKNYGIIQKALNAYPITAFEIEYNKIANAIELLENKNWRELLKYAVDNNLSATTKNILERDYESCKKNLTRILNNLVSNKQNLLPISTYKGDNYKYLTKKILRYSRIEGGLSCDDVLNHIAACKKQILDDCIRHYDKESKIAGLTKDFFENELQKENIELVIVKLCVRLEAILRCDYQYNGSFAEMLDKYCNAKLHWTGDDGWGYPTDECDRKTIGVLNKLRMKRNNIVHAEQNPVELTIDDIRYCIEYICKMG